MDPLLHTRDEGTVKTMNFTGWISSEEDEDHEIGWKGDGHSFLGCMRYNSYRLSSVEANDQWWLLYLISIIPYRFNILKKKRSHLAKKKVFFHQDNARVHTCLGHRWPNSTNSATNCFPIQHISARFSPLRPFPVSKPRNSSEERHAPP